LPEGGALGRESKIAGSGLEKQPEGLISCKGGEKARGAAAPGTENGGAIGEGSDFPAVLYRPCLF
jgi:hypothetical protein